MAIVRFDTAKPVRLTIRARMALSDAADPTICARMVVSTSIWWAAVDSNHLPPRNRVVSIVL
jgi:hypothetical protein